MNVKTITLSLLVGLLSQGCSSPGNNTEKARSSSTITAGKNYTLYLYEDNYDDPSGEITLDSAATPLNAPNDTVAYLTALKKFYNQRVIDRKNLHFGQPRSFMVTDKNGVDLKTTLPRSLTEGLKSQVENLPDVKTMIEEYKQDSI